MLLIPVRDKALAPVSLGSTLLLFLTDTELSAGDAAAARSLPGVAAAPRSLAGVTPPARSLTGVDKASRSLTGVVLSASKLSVVGLMAAFCSGPQDPLRGAAGLALAAGSGVPTTSGSDGGAPCRGDGPAARLPAASSVPL